MTPYDRAPWFLAILTVPHGTSLGHRGLVWSPTAVYALPPQTANDVPTEPLPKVLSFDVPVMNFCMIWSDSFQHFVFDTLPRVAFALPFLLAHQEV